MNDIVEPGAFKKTIAERGPSGSNRIRVLWQHSAKEVIGRPLTLEEHSRDLLPEAIRTKYLGASGGLFARTKIVKEVQRGREAFALLQENALGEWSIGFNDMTNEGNGEVENRDGKSVRHLREIRLWEYSPVTWGANEATTTVSVKSNLFTMLDEVAKEHPEFSDRQLITAVEKRLSPELPAASSSQQQKHGVESLRIQVMMDELRLRGKL